MNSIDDILTRFNADDIIRELSPFINSMRQQRIEDVLAGRLHNIQLAIECVADINNAMATTRTAEALGVTHMHIIAPEHTAGSTKRVTQGAFHWVDVRFYDSFAEFEAVMRSQHFLLAGGALHPEKPPCSLPNVPVDQLLCLMVGNEHRGLSAEALAACDIVYQIPMFGMSESMNLSVAAAISLYDTASRMRTQLGKNSDLSPAQYAQLKAKYYIQSVSPRTVKNLYNTSQ